MIKVTGTDEGINKRLYGPTGREVSNRFNYDRYKNPNTVEKNSEFYNKLIKLQQKQIMTLLKKNIIERRELEIFIRFYNKKKVFLNKETYNILDKVQMIFRAIFHAFYDEPAERGKYVPNPITDNFEVLGEVKQLVEKYSAELRTSPKIKKPKIEKVILSCKQAKVYATLKNASNNSGIVENTITIKSEIPINFDICITLERLSCIEILERRSILHRVDFKLKVFDLEVEVETNGAIIQHKRTGNGKWKTDKTHT